jgi:2-oxo-4-hydroxy-4-carboxy-5-ureidoimidazoline decarboxylase
MKTEGSCLTLTDLNLMDRQHFTQALGGIFEHSPWVAEAAFPLRPFTSVAHLHEVMLEAARYAEETTQLELLRAHPDLATRMKVSPLSAAEQQGAGLDSLSNEEYAQLAECNQRYMEKFGFPFILAVRGKSKSDILRSIAERIESSLELEQERAWIEIGKITRFRLEDLVVT